MLCALVQNNVVVSIVTIPDDGGISYAQTSQGYQAAIDITATLPQPQVGWTFDGANLISNGTNTTKITKLAFRERFTIAEMTGIYATMPTNFTLQAMIANQQVATFVDLSRSDTIAGVGYLVSIGLITQDRATAILTTPPTAVEVYTG